MEGRRCRQCDEILTKQNSSISAQTKYIYLCRSCANENRKKWRLENLDIARAKDRKSRLLHRDYYKRQIAKWREKNRDTVREYARTHAQTPEYKKKRASFILAVKIEVLGHYGQNGVPECKCGFKDIRALSLDHIYGDGATHRRKLKGACGYRMYAILKASGFPAGYQTLCMNCQWIKKFENKEYGKRSRKLKSSAEPIKRMPRLSINRVLF